MSSNAYTGITRLLTSTILFQELFVFRCLVAMLLRHIVVIKLALKIKLKTQGCVCGFFYILGEVLTKQLTFTILFQEMFIFSDV